MISEINDNNHYNDDEPIVNPSGFFNELSQNTCSVRVAVRVRPLIVRELNENMGAGGQPRTCVAVSQDDNKLQIGEKQYQFDRVFSPDESQNEIFDVCARNLVLGCFGGYNATIIAYGQTGSGKTHTMGTGTTNGLDESEIGIVPRVFQLIFEELDRKRKQSSLSEFTIKVSFLELYNEELHDLLDIGVIDRVTGKPTKDLLIKEKNGSIIVHGLKEETVQSTQDCIELLNKGISHRTTSATLMNEGSSRSHAIFTIAIEQKIVKEIDVPEGAAEAKGDLPGQQEEQITAKFHFVDLAGSERLKRTGAVGKLMQEGISINKGLLCLGNVISALTDEHKKDKHIPYRDSKLTRILQDSLGGNSRTTVIACVSPAESNYEESLNSIKYASRARNIKNKAVVNRDPNSLLIDSLRQQISKCQGEISAYQQLLKDTGVTIPTDFAESIQKRVDEQRKSPSRPPGNFEGGDFPSKAMSQQEVNQFKIQLSKKEEKLKDLTTQLSSLTDKLIERNTRLEELQKERDYLKFKNDILTEHCQKNNINVELPVEGVNITLVDEYKAKIDMLQKQLDQKILDNNERQSKIDEMIKSKAKDDKLVHQYSEEIQRLKASVKRQDFSNHSPPQMRQQQQMAKNFKLNLQNVNPEKLAGEMPNFVFDAEGINKKIIDSMSSQLDSLFNTHQEESEPHQLTRTPSKNPVKPEQEEDLLDPIVSNFTASATDEEQSEIKLMEEKQKILSIAMEGFQRVKSEYEEMAKHKYEELVKKTETDLRNMDNEKQATLKKTTDSKQIQAIELQYKSKMDELGKQLATFREKEKQQELMAKQISLRESKIKNLEEDVGKMRKNTENLEKKLRSEQDKISEYKITTQKEISQTKKNLSDKEKEVMKLKEDLVKRDQVMHTKLEEMKLQQRQQYEERLRRELEKGEQDSKHAMDIDRIKVWIQSNTDRMLRQRELQELGDQHIQEMEMIEIEMEEEAERLTELTIERDRKVIEMEELVAIAEESEEPDEGPILELEEDLYKLTVEIERVEELLQTKEEKYNLLINNNEDAFKESATLGFKSIEPLKFSGLKSIESAKLTLEVFFDQLLNLNFQKRDLEKQCITQDEQVIEMASKLSAMQAQVIEFSTKLQNQSFHLKSSTVLHEVSAVVSQSDRVAQATKEKALKNIINAMEGYVEYDNVKNLGLKPNEMNSLTKLSLSKIVSNHKQQLEEEKKRNHNLVLKLEAALSEKEQLKLKYDNLKKKNKDEAFFKDPLMSQSVPSQMQSNQETKTQQSFQNYAAVRASRKGTNQQASMNKLQSDIDKAKEILQTTPSNQGKYKSRIGGARANDESEAQAKRFNKQLSTNVGSIKKPLFNLGNNSSGKKQSRSSSRDQEPQQQLKQSMPSFMNRTKASINQVAHKKQHTAAAAVAPQHKSRQMPPLPQVPSFVSEDSVQILDEQNQFQKPHMNLQDRRNQRKMITTQDSMGTATGNRIMNDEIDKIKEATQMITTGSQHYQRQQSRAREYSKKIQNERSNTRYNQSQGGAQNTSGSFDMSNLKGLQEDDNEESPRNNQQLSSGIEEDGYGEEQIIQAPQQPWIYEELAQLMNGETRLIGCECFNGKIVLVFENFVVREIDLYTLEEKPQINLLHINGLQDLDETAVDMAVDKELEAIAIATPMFVYVFDFTYQYQAKIQAESIEKVLFCQYHIVVMVNAGDSAYFICYQIDDQTEVGCFDIKNGDAKTIMKTDNNFIYLACGIKLMKLSVPDLTQVFMFESEHEASIIDMTITPSTIVTTSFDKSVRVHQLDSGEQCMNSLENADCDHLDSCEDFIFTRLQDGAQIVVFRSYEGALDLNFVNEIDLREFKDQIGEVIDFKMQGKILTRLSQDPYAPNYQIILLVTIIADLIFVNALKYKPLSEL